MLAIAAIFALLVLVGGGRLWWRSYQFVETENAYVTGHVHPVSSRVVGVVSKVLTDDNQNVREGDVIAGLDPADQRAEVEQIWPRSAQRIMWAALPQLVMMPLASRLSVTVDNRILCSIGLALFGAACLMNAGMDATIGYDQPVAAQIVRALGAPFIILTLQNFAMNGIAQRDVASAFSLYNMTRNLGGAIGIALLATTLTNREHFHSARLGEAISSYSAVTQLRLDQLTQSFMSRAIEPLAAADQALQVISHVVHREAYVMAYNDSFWIIGMILFACIGMLWFADKTLGGGVRGR